MPPNPRHDARTPEGRPVIFDWRDNGMYLPPHIYEDGENFVVSAETEEQAFDAAKTKLKRLGRNDEGTRLKPVESNRKKGPLEARMSLSMSSTIRAKIAAKITLGALSLVLNDDWLGSDSAQLLQSWLWEDPPKLANGGTIFAAPKKVPHPFDKFCRPPEHLLWCFPGNRQRTRFAISLFGEEFMVVDAGRLDDPSMDIAWALDPVARSWEVTTFGDLLMRGRDIYEREMAEEEFSERL